MAGRTPRDVLCWRLVVCCLTCILSLAASQGKLGDPCEAWRGGEGTCTPADCKTLKYEEENIPIGEFIRRHSAPCGTAPDGNKLVCCPKDHSELVTQGCGMSPLNKHKGSGEAFPNSWPWLATLYTKITGPGGFVSWTPLGCFGVLLSEKYVLTNYHCGAHKGLAGRVHLGEHMKGNHTGIQNISVAHIIRLEDWEADNVHLALLLLDKHATMKPNEVWPICLSEDPLNDLGFPLDGLGTFDKQFGFTPYWPSAGDNYISPLYQTQVFYTNCSQVCEGHFADDYACNNYNATNGNRNPLCMGGQSQGECRSRQSAEAVPFVVQSSINGNFYLAGVAQTAYCGFKHLNTMLTPISPYARIINRFVK